MVPLDVLSHRINHSGNFSGPTWDHLATGPTFQELFYGQKKFPKAWSPLSDHSKILISTQGTWIHLCLFWLLGITWQTGPTFQELFYDPKKFPKGWSPLSGHSKIPISTQGTRIHLCLFWLLGITWQIGPTFQKLF